MATSEADLKNQLADLDWGTAAAQAPAVLSLESTDAADPGTDGSGDGLTSLDVAVPGVKPAPVRRSRRGGRDVKRQPRAQALLDAARDGQTVAASTPPQGASRRGRNTAPDVLIQAGESPAVVALFDAMWKDVGSKLARGIGRPKASRQDAAIGWYALLLAMRERDAKK